MKYIVFFISISIFQVTFSQDLLPFSQNKKWGFIKNDQVIIPAQYDTVFGFDYKNQIALVANQNTFLTETNPLTGEESIVFDYYFINEKNQKIKVLPNHYPDSIDVFPDQQELIFSYKENSQVFKVLFQNKIYLISKAGRQLSSGYDNIYRFKNLTLFVVENYTEKQGNQIRVKGLIDTLGNIIIPNKYSSIKYNEEDSIIYTCTSSVVSRGNDDVFLVNGKLVHSDKRHIEFASKKGIVYHEFQPVSLFVFENLEEQKNKEIEGEKFYYLKHNKSLIISHEDWYIVDLLTFKKTKVDQKDLFKKWLTLYYE